MIQVIKKDECTRKCINFTVLLYFVASCGDSTPLNGQANPQVPGGIYNESTIVSFSCDYGYSLSGAGSSTCNPQGSWNAQPPICNQSNHIIE